MATYTIELRKLCNIYSREEIENWFKQYELSDYLTPEQLEIVQKSVWSKDKLATKIVNHYFMREIGYETPDLFKLQAKIKLQEIMETYSHIIYSNALKYDPLVNVDFTESFEREIEGTAENKGNSLSNSNSNGSSLNISSDTPQTNISKESILKGDYASSAGTSESTGNINDTTNTQNQGKSNTIEKYTRSQKGNSGALTTAQALVKQYRDTIYAVDTKIIKELNSLFMGIY